MRCFIAVELSESIRRAIGALQQRHAGVGTGVRWVHPEQIHLTLKFLGEAPEGDVAAIAAAIGEVAAKASPFAFGVRSAGCFPPHGSAKVFWVGVDEPTGALARLAAGIDGACAGLGYAPEQRAYTPHLTVARVKDFRAGHGVRDACRAEAGFDAGTQAVREVVLFQSILGGDRPKYVPMARVPLGK